MQTPKFRRFALSLPSSLLLAFPLLGAIAISCMPSESDSGEGGTGGKASVGTGGSGTGGTTTPGTGGATTPAGTGGSQVAGSGGSGSGGATPTGTGGRGGAGTTGSGGRGAGGQGGGGGRGTVTGSGGATGMGGNTGAGGGLGLKNPPVKSEGCGKDLGTLKTGSFTIMASDGMRREYSMDIPTNYNKDTPHKLFFIWHWISAKDDDVINNGFYGLKRQAMSANDPVIFIAPQSNDGTWDKEDHVLFDDLLKLAKTSLCVDTTRVFATGFSFGGMITYSLSIAKQKDLRAVVGIAPANWNIYLPTNTHQPIAYMSTTGMGDGMCKWVYNDARKEGAKYAAIGHAEDNGCTIPADVPSWQSGNHVCYDFQNCKTGYPVKACTFNGGHVAEHNEGGQNWIATESWKFFSQF